MNRLPTEVWLLIITYLPSKEAKGLFGVDRQLTDIVLDLRYQVAVAAPCFMRQYLSEPCNFVLPQVFHRVRELVFKDDPPIVPYKNMGKFHVPVYRVAAVKRLFSAKHWALRQYYNQLLKRVTDLENVQAITFHFTRTFYNGTHNLHQPYVKHKMRIFRALATVRASQITRLSISADLHTITPYWPNDISLPNLKKLCFKIRFQFFKDVTPIPSFFHPFINQHIASLEDFTLIPDPELMLQDVLQGIQHLPRLRKFFLCWFMWDTPIERQALSRFMKDYVSQLVEFRLRLVPTCRGVLDSRLDYVFSSLRHLSLYIDAPTRSLVASVRRFLLRHSNQLLSLHLLPHHIQPNDIHTPNFISHFQLENGHFVSFSVLQDLSIYSRALDIELISFLVTSLPLLRYLCIQGLLSLSILTSSASFQDLERMLQSWELSNLDLLGETRVWKFDDKERLACLFAGAKRICGRLPLEWAKDREFLGSHLPLRVRVAPDYYDQDD